MLKVCIEEVNAVNKPHNHFTKLGWANILIGKYTDLGWDEKKKTIAASDERWEAKIKEDPEVAKFREQDLKFLLEMEFLFKGTIAIGFAAYAPSEYSRQNEGFNTRTKETNDNIDDNTEMEVNEPEINTTTQTTSSTKESGQRKKGESAQDPTSITACVAKLKDLLGLERGSELFYKANRLMKNRANKITFVALEEPEL
ncbi:L10-interacting MYB domain-containing protein [Glycine soja]